jgi:hypothetical protein
MAQAPWERKAGLQAQKQQESNNIWAREKQERLLDAVVDEARYQ